MSQTSKKILLVVRDFPPYYRTLGGVLRAVQLADFLRNRGVEVHVVTARGEEIGYFGYEEVIRQLDVHYVKDPIRQLSNRRTLNAASGRGSRSPWRAKLTGSLQAMVDDLMVPDLSVLFVGRLYRKALEVISEYGIRNVLISSPPHSTQLVGLKLKRVMGERINLIVDYRDSWNCTQICSKRNPLSKILNEHLEEQVLKATDHFVYVSRPILEKINRRYFDITRKSVLVMNGFDPRTRSQEHVQHVAAKHMNIGCFGRISRTPREGRDPTRLLQTIAKLGLPIRVILYGDIDQPYTWTAGFNGSVQVRGNLPHNEAVGHMRRMDLLLLVFSQIQDADEVISGKLFDYVLAERPILVVGSKDMEAGRIVTTRKLGFHLDINDEHAMADGLAQIYAAWRDGTLPHYRWTDLKEFSRPNQFEKLLPILV